MSTKKIRRSRRSLPGTAGWLLGAVVLTALVSSACSPRLLRGPAGDNTPLSKINPADLTVEGLPKPPDNIQPVKLPQHGSHSLLAAPLAGMKQLRRDPIPSQNVPPNSLAQQPPGRVLLAALTNSPFQPLGRLHVKGAAGWRWCSAQLVGSLDVILTAAHCVFDQDKADFFSDAVFAEGYDNGTSKSEHWWKCVAVYSGWRDRMDRYDYAFIKLRSRGAAALGLQASSGQSPLISVGYPENANSGEMAMYVIGQIGNGDQAAEFRMGTNTMGEGSSGGAWIDGTYAEGVNSYGADGEGDVDGMYGPVFDEQTLALFDFVKNDCKQGGGNGS